MSGLLPTSSPSTSLLLLEDKVRQWEGELNNKDSEKTGQEKIASSKAEARREIAHIRLQIAEMRSDPLQCNIHSISNLFRQLDTAQKDFAKGNEQYNKNKLDVIASNKSTQEKIDRFTFNVEPISKTKKTKERDSFNFSTFPFDRGPFVPETKQNASQKDLSTFLDRKIQKQTRDWEQRYLDKVPEEKKTLCKDSIKIAEQKLGLTKNICVKQKIPVSTSEIIMDQQIIDQESILLQQCPRAIE